MTFKLETFGDHEPLWKIGPVGAGAGQLTLEDMVRAADLVRKDFGRPDVEYHHSRCPKILSGGEKACRCGAAPLEAIFEDENLRAAGGKP